MPPLTSPVMPVAGVDPVGVGIDVVMKYGSTRIQSQ